MAVMRLALVRLVGSTETTSMLAEQCSALGANRIGLRDRNSPKCTLSQNGYGDMHEQCWLASTIYVK